MAPKVGTSSEASSFPILSPQFLNVADAVSAWPLLSVRLFAQTCIFLFSLFSYTGWHTLVLLRTLPHPLPTIRSPGNPSTRFQGNPRRSFVRCLSLCDAGVRRLIRPLSRVRRPTTLSPIANSADRHPVFMSGAGSPGKHVCSWLEIAGFSSRQAVPVPILARGKPGFSKVRAHRSCHTSEFLSVW